MACSHTMKNHEALRFPEQTRYYYNKISMALKVCATLHTLDLQTALFCMQHPYKFTGEST